jgi:hypothetical protein
MASLDNQRSKENGNDEIEAILMACLLAGGFALWANAGVILDEDMSNPCVQTPDGVPNNFDNCIYSPNGPDAPLFVSNDQVDVDADGFGIACDPDYNQDCTVGVADFNIFFACFTCPPPDGSGFSCGATCAGALTAAGVASIDHNQDTTIGVGDFQVFFQHFLPHAVPGPSCGGPCGTLGLTNGLLGDPLIDGEGACGLGVPGNP